MNRKEIETKDRLLLDKIRETVKFNEETAAQKKGLWTQMTKIWIPVLFIGLIVVALWAFKQQPATVAQQESIPAASETVEKSVAQVEHKAAEQEPAIKPESSEPEQSKPEATDAPESSDTAVAEAEPVSVASAPDQSEASAPDQSETEIAPEPTEKRIAEAQPTESEPADGSSNVKIAEIVACSGVSERQYVSPRGTFSLSEAIKPAVWMNVLSEKQPFVLTHVYYVNDQKYAEVPLNIRYPRNRTWSNITLSHQGQIGDWRVDVVNESGETLAHVQFTVVP